MHFLTFDGVIVAAGLLLEAALIFTFFRRGLAKIYPIFLLYLIVNLIEDPLTWVVDTPGSHYYRRYYFAISVLDSILQLLILFEVGRNVFRPSKRAIPFPTWPIGLAGVLLCGAAAITLSPHLQLSPLQQENQVFFRLTLGLAILKVLMFAFMAGFAQFLGIGWKNHVLQLASGLAFYGAASLLFQIGISHASSGDHATFIAQYVQLTRYQAVAYLGTLGFWIWAFSRNEAPRKDFTPQMQQVLVTIASTARRTRLAVTRSGDQT